MMICPACGATYENGRFCGRDGTALVPGVAQPPAGVPDGAQGSPVAPQASAVAAQVTPVVPQASAAGPAGVPGVPPVAPRGGRLPRAGLVAIIGVACVALAVGAAFAVPAIINVLRGGATGGGQEGAGLAVTGVAPAESDWSSGVRQAWTSPGLDIDHFVAQSDSVWVFGTSVDPGDTMGLIGVATSDGSPLWTKDGDWMCADVIGETLPCVNLGRSEFVVLDLRTGVISSTTEWTDFGLPQTFSPNYISAIGGSQVIVAGPKSPEPGAGDDPDVSGNPYEATVIDVSTLRATWTKEYPRCAEPDLDDSSFEVIQSQHDGGIFARAGMIMIGDYAESVIVNAATGEPVLSPTTTCEPLTIMTAHAIYGASAASFNSPAGGTGVVLNPRTDLLPIQLAGTAVPDQTIVVTPGDDVWVNALPQGNDGTSGDPLWAANVPSATNESEIERDALVGAFDGSHLVLTRPDGGIQSVDPETGETQWQISLPASFNNAHRSYGFLSDGTLIATDLMCNDDNCGGAGSFAIDMDTGKELWEFDGWIGSYSDGGISGPLDRGGLLATKNEDDAAIRLVPANQPAATAIPSDAPGCPSGMTAVSWTRYADGSVLVCRGNSAYAVVDSHGWTATELHFVDGGYEVVYDNGARVQAWLGGVLVTVNNGQTVTYVAGESWSVATGVSTFTQTPSGVQSCPSGSWPISLSTWDGGWLLVCGTSASAPTSLTYSDGGNTGSASSVSGTGGGYCGDAPVGSVCVYQAPSVVVIGGTQHSVPDNYFADGGYGGAGKGNGSYDVPAPSDTAKDQVRYLVGILNKSAASRKALGPASENVLACKKLSSAVTEIDQITKNREDLLTALDSTPVDQIPGGDSIVAKLRAALEASRDADRAWAAWGRDQKSYGCSERPQEVVDAQDVVNDAKNAFCDAWNTQIAGTYGVKKFTRDQI